MALFSLNAVAAAKTRIEVQGHRGARASRPENTIPAFDFAIEAGADVLELDLQVTKDNALVISHDANINPEHCLMDDGKKIEQGPLIHTLTLAEVKKYDCGSLPNKYFHGQVPVPHTHLATLDELFDHVKASKLEGAKTIQFNIETKITPEKPDEAPAPDVFAKMVINCLNRHHMLKRSIIQSFDFRTLVAARKLEPKARISALIEKPEIDPIETAKTLKADIISPQFKLVTAEMVQKLHQMKVRVLPWTVNEPADWEKMINLKVDGIISDNPQGLIDYLKLGDLR